MTETEFLLTKYLKHGVGLHLVQFGQRLTDDRPVIKITAMQQLTEQKCALTEQDLRFLELLVVFCKIHADAMDE